MPRGKPGSFGSDREGLVFGRRSARSAIPATDGAPTAPAGVTASAAPRPQTRMFSAGQEGQKVSADGGSSGIPARMGRAEGQCRTEKGKLFQRRTVRSRYFHRRTGKSGVRPRKVRHAFAGEGQVFLRGSGSFQGGGLQMRKGQKLFASAPPLALAPASICSQTSGCCAYLIRTSGTTDMPGRSARSRFSSARLVKSIRTGMRCTTLT